MAAVKPSHVVRFTLTEDERQSLVDACNSELKEITDLSDPRFETWFELRKKLNSAALVPTARKPRAKKGDAEACAAPVAAALTAPALATAA